MSIIFSYIIVGLLLITSVISAVLGIISLISRRKHRSKRQTYKELYEDNDIGGE